MKKYQLFIILLVVMVLLVLADYRVTQPEGLTLPENSSAQPLENIENTSGSQASNPSDSKPVPSHSNITQSALDQSAELSVYTIEKRTRVVDLFESFDLSAVPNLVAYKNTLVPTSQATGLPIYVYEIQSTPGQGKVNYLAIKQSLEKQLQAQDQLNETGQFGTSSLYYNDATNKTVGFLLVQMKDTVFGFQFAKNPEDSFNYIQTFIKDYQSKIINS